MTRPSDSSISPLMVIAPRDDAPGESRQAFLHVCVARHAGVNCRVTAPEGSWIARQCRASGIDFVPLLSGINHRLGGRILRQSIKADTPKVFHGFGADGASLAVRQAKATGQAAIASLYSADCPGSVLGASHILAGDTATADALEQAGAAPESLTCHGFAVPDRGVGGQFDRASARANLRISDDQIAVWVPGPLHPDMGQISVIETLENLTDDRLRVFFAGARDSDYARTVQLRGAQMAATAGGMVGHIDDLSLLKGFDLSVSPVLEGHAVHYALAPLVAGLPLVCHPVGVLRDLMIDGETGFLSQRSDSAGLQKALERLLADIPDSRRMGEAAKARMQEHAAMKVVARRYLSVLRDTASTAA